MVRGGTKPLTPRYLLIRLNRPNTYHAAIQEADFLIEGLLRFLRDAYDKDVGAPPRPGGSHSVEAKDPHLWASLVSLLAPCDLRGSTTPPVAVRARLLNPLSTPPLATRNEFA